MKKSYELTKEEEKNFIELFNKNIQEGMQFLNEIAEKHNNQIELSLNTAVLLFLNKIDVMIEDDYLTENEETGELEELFTGYNVEWDDDYIGMNESQKRKEATEFLNCFIAEDRSIQFWK